MIPEGSNPPHGAIPKPPPKPKPQPKPGEEVDLAKLAQARAASEAARRKIDYQRTNQPSGKMIKVKIMLYDMRSFFKACVELYLIIVGKKAAEILSKPAPTPFLSADDKAYDDSEEPRGVLQSKASKVIMKVLYGARMCRYDLLHACQALACKVTKWSLRCDRRLHRLIAYIHQSIDLCMYGWIGDDSIALRLWLYTDADFAADQSDSKSVSGVFCALQGPTSFFPLCALSKKQSSVSHSTCESEMVAADLGLRTEAIPLMTLLDQLFQREVRCLFLEDNQSTLRNITTGKMASLRHLSRTHRVNTHWVAEVCRELPIDLGACESHLMAADIFTKIFAENMKWVDVMRLIGHLRWNDFLTLFNRGNKSFPEKPKKTTETKTIPLHDTNQSITSPDMQVILGGVAAKKGKNKMNLTIVPTRDIKIDRYIFEWCCSLDSLMGKLFSESIGSRLFRFTEREDMTTWSGIDFAKSIVRGAPMNMPIMIWTALPCTGGSPWQNINRHMPGGMERLRAHWKLFDALLEKIEHFVGWLSKQNRNWRITMEWPRNCAYWRRPKVLKFCLKFGLADVTFDGCRFGVAARSGLLLKKPWRLCSNDHFVLTNFQDKHCTGDHEHGECRGVDCKLSENYSWRMVRLVHRSFRQSASNLDKSHEFQIFTSASCMVDYFACACVDCNAWSRSDGMFDYFYDADVEYIRGSQASCFAPLTSR